MKRSPHDFFKFGTNLSFLPGLQIRNMWRVLQKLLPITVLFYDFEKLDFKNEGCTSGDRSRRWVISIRQIGRNHKFVVPAFLHQLQAFGPSRNDTIKWKFSWFSTAVRAVKLFTVDQRPSIVDTNNGIFIRTGSVTLLDNSVLET